MTSCKLLLPLALGTLVVLTTGGCGGGEAASWIVRENAGVLQISYGSGVDYPQYAALHLASGYLRLVPTRTAGWGTSVVLLPSLWTGGAYHQGAAITSTPVVEGDDLLIPFTGTIAGLTTTGQVRLSPPAEGKLRAQVTVSVAGSATLDNNRPGEAFKPVMLSSMHLSATQWDAQSAFLGTQTYPLPAAGWIVTPPASAQVFGLRGGTSTWKTEAPTLTVTLDQARPITGWVTASADPNDDNVGLWASADTVLGSWEYELVAEE